MHKAILVCVLFATHVLGQQIRAFGEVAEDAGQFRLVTPGLTLEPGSMPLSAFTGKFVDVTGTLVMGAPTTTIAVSSITETNDTFELKGSTRIGDTLRLRIESPSALTYYFVASPAPGFTPLEPLALPIVSGTVYVDLPTTTVAAGALNASYEHPLPIPNNTALVGTEIWFQGAIFNGAFVYINARKATLTN